jgi:hypothetical protein
MSQRNSGINMKLDDQELDKELYEQVGLLLDRRELITGAHRSGGPGQRYFSLDIFWSAWPLVTNPWPALNLINLQALSHRANQVIPLG